MAPVPRTVLVVDDSPEDRELYRRYLRRDSDFAYTFIEASLGQEGLDRWQQHQPDILLLDYRLPDLDGLEFLAQLSAASQQSYLPVIVVTGQGSETIAVKTMKAGAQDYLVKEQITPESLQWAVSHTIETVQLRLQVQQSLERERAARAEAERANRIKDEFLAILSHELRTPLNPILGWAKLLKTRNLDSATTAKALDTIERNAKLQTQLVDDLLDVARILRGKLRLQTSPVDLVSVTELAIDTVQAAAAAKDISLNPVLPEVGQVLGDATRLQQIVWNLLSNAIKFTPNGGRVDVRLEPISEPESQRAREPENEGESGGVGEGERRGEPGAGSQVPGPQNPLPPDLRPPMSDTHPPANLPTRQPVISSSHSPIPPSTSPSSATHAQIIVSDTGKGIKSEFLPHLFESFRQEDASTTRNHGGLGLGLAIVRYLVEAHGGTIWASSKGEGKGATFTIQLPLLKVSAEAVPDHDEITNALDLKGLRVLAVDDDRDTCDLITTFLSGYGAEVLALSSATEALENFAAFQPDLLICDIGMPDINGYDLLRRIRALVPETRGQIPAIAVTAYAREKDRQEALDKGFQKHIAKPFDPELLASAISELISL
jgi:signal transduction histidine kinase